MDTLKRTYLRCTAGLAACVAAMLLSFASCITEENFEDNAEGNFEAMWKILDEHYCFFGYKDIDWNKVHDEYAARIIPDMPPLTLFEVLAEMANELQDGHVNLYSSFDVSRYHKWYEDYPANFNDSIHKLYLGKSDEYQMAGGIKYKIFQDNIGYMYYESFASGVGDGNLTDMLYLMALCDGLIIDVRNNGGGDLSNATRLAARFTDEKVLTGYMLHKTGPGHDDFSDPYPIWLEPYNGVRWQKPVVVLTNRSAFSATNDFVNSMKGLSRVTVIGDRTGGGSGLPFTSELPNGWLIRFSASPVLDRNGEQIEFGIEPDIKVNQTQEDIIRNRDTLIEYARNYLKGLAGTQ